MTSARDFSIAILLLIILLTASLGIATYNTQDDAFVYIAIAWCTVCISVVVWCRSNNTIRGAALCIGSVMLVFGLFEAYLSGWFPGQYRTYLNGTLTRSGLYEPHPILGYVLKSNISTTIQGHHGNELLYDFTLTTDQHALRVTPANHNPAAPAALFLGGSFTFGHGVSDQESAPYIFQENSKGAFKAFNLGVNGYGPHQMLAILEHALEREMVQNHKPRIAIYQAIPSHIDRVAGRAMWDQAGPRYILDGDHSVRYGGPFHGSLYNDLFIVLKKSHILNRVMGHWLHRERNRSDEKVFIEIVKKSERIFKERYGGKFYVLLWDFSDPSHKKVVSNLIEHHINVMRIEDILPDYRLHKKKYRIPYDNHPNKLAHKHVAQYLSQFLQEEVM